MIKKLRLISLLSLALLTSGLLLWFVPSVATTVPIPPMLVKSVAVGEPSRIEKTRFVDAAGQPVFLWGANYEGHTDRAWQLWDKFDPDLIAANFQQAQSAGINVLRIFVQKTLRTEVEAANWQKFDKVIELANSFKLRLLITFNDYDEPNLSREAALNQKIATRYKDNPTVLGYDLKNEPQFADIGTAIYLNPVPLQIGDFIKTYGERVSRSGARNLGVVPSHLNDQAAYAYANAYLLWQDFLAQAEKWATANNKTVLDYLDQPASEGWKTFLTALDLTLNEYIAVRQNAIRAADPDAIITIGWNVPVLAKLAANSRLSFVSLHRFVADGIVGLNTTFSLLQNLQTTFSQSPIVLEEFGYSNARTNTALVDERLSANHENAVWLWMYAKGLAGGFKWMLTNYPLGYNPVENNFGLLNNDAQPKLSYHALRALTNAQLTFTTQNIVANGSEIEYAFTGPNTVFANLPSFANEQLEFKQAVYSPFAIWWDADETNFLATQKSQLSLKKPADKPPLNLFANGQFVQALAANPNSSFALETGVLYSLTAKTSTKIIPLPTPPTTIKKEGGYSLERGFQSFWEKNGGLIRFGLPISEPIIEDGLLVQYYERVRLEYHPEASGTAFEVIITDLGRRLTANRQNEAAFQPLGSFADTAIRRYFAPTGHSLAYTFKTFWERNGGLNSFGYPISEEFKEQAADGRIWTVQYFERAKFEFHPELARTPYEVSLTHLGREWLQKNGK